MLFHSLLLENVLNVPNKSLICSKNWNYFLARNLARFTVLKTGYEIFSIIERNINLLNYIDLTYA